MNESRAITPVELKNLNIDADLSKAFLVYVHAKIETQIQELRTLSQWVKESNMRQEYLGRIDSLQLVKSGLSIERVAYDIGSLQTEEEKLNVY